MEKKSKSENVFIINEFLSVKLIYDETIIFVKDKKFMHCKSLIINIPINRIGEYDKIDSIDDAIELTRKLTFPRMPSRYYIDPKTEFWGHCSNLQAWSDSKYNTCVLHSNLSFPLLRKLAQAGDPLARRVIKDEIAKRFMSGHMPVLTFLLKQGFLGFLNKEELQTLKESNIDAKFWNSLGKYYLKTKKIDNALESLTRAIQLNQESGDIWMNFGRVLTHQNKYKKALKCFKRALLLEPENIKTWIYLGEAYLKADMINKAEKMIEFGKALVRRLKFFPLYKEIIYDVEQKIRIKSWEIEQKIRIKSWEIKQKEKSSQKNRVIKNREYILYYERKLRRSFFDKLPFGSLYLDRDRFEDPSDISFFLNQRN